MNKTATANMAMFSKNVTAVRRRLGGEKSGNGSLIESTHAYPPPPFPSEKLHWQVGRRHDLPGECEAMQTAEFGGWGRWRGVGKWRPPTGFFYWSLIFLIPPVLQNHTTQPKSYNLTKFNKTMVRAW